MCIFYQSSIIYGDITDFYRVILQYRVNIYYVVPIELNLIYLHWSNLTIYLLII